MGTTMKMQRRGHVTSTVKIRNVHMILIEHTTRKTAQDKPRRRQRDDFKLVSQRNKTLTYLTRAFVSTVMDHRGSLQSAHFLTNEVTIFFFQGKSYTRKLVMNAVTTMSTEFEQILSINKDIQMTGNKNKINPLNTELNPICQ